MSNRLSIEQVLSLYADKGLTGIPSYTKDSRFDVLRGMHHVKAKGICVTSGKKRTNEDFFECGGILPLLLPTLNNATIIHEPTTLDLERYIIEGAADDNCLILEDVSTPHDSTENDLKDWEESTFTKLCREIAETRLVIIVDTYRKDTFWEGFTLEDTSEVSENNDNAISTEADAIIQQLEDKLSAKEEELVNKGSLIKEREVELTACAEQKAKLEVRLSEVTEQLVEKESLLSRYVETDDELKNEVAHLKQSLSDREKELSGKEEALTAKEQELEAKEKELSSRDEEFNKAVEECHIKDKALEDKEKDLVAKEAELEEKLKEYNTLRDTQMTQMENLAVREQNVAAKETELIMKEEEINRRELELSNYEDHSSSYVDNQDDTEVMVGQVQLSTLKEEDDDIDQDEVMGGEEGSNQSEVAEEDNADQDEVIEEETTYKMVDEPASQQPEIQAEAEEVESVFDEPADEEEVSKDTVAEEVEESLAEDTVSEEKAEQAQNEEVEGVTEVKDEDVICPTDGITLAYLKANPDKYTYQSYAADKDYSFYMIVGTSNYYQHRKSDNSLIRL